MKKTLYNIMNEAEAGETTALLEKIECETPAGVSAKNIKAKTLRKCGLKKKNAGALILRYGAIAACVALIVAAVPTIQNFGGTSTTGQNYKVPEDGIYEVIRPSIAYADSISYTYYLPLEGDTVLCKEVIFKLENGKSKETWKELLEPFFTHCELDVRVVDWKITAPGEKTEISEDGETVTYTPGAKTLTLYFEGTAALDDHTLKCLVNTIDSISYLKYHKLVYNGVPVAIEGECPEEGFKQFK